MVKYSGCEVLRDYLVFVEIDEEGVLEGSTRVDHDTDELDEHLNNLPDGTPVAIENSGSCTGLLIVLNSVKRHEFFITFRQ